MTSPKGVIISMIICGSLTIGCTGWDGTEREAIQLSEEAGIRVVDIQDLWSADWPELPGLSIDTLVGPLDGDDFGLMAPLHAAHLSDGRTVLADPGARRLWIGSRSGQWEEGPGSREGPAQIRAIGGVWADGSGFVVHDAQSGDLVHFDESAGLIGRHPVGEDVARHGPGVRAGPWPPTVQSLGRGEWLVGVAAFEDPVDGSPMMHGRYTYSRVSANPAEREFEIASGPARTVIVQGGGGAFIPYGRTAYVAGAAGESGEAGSVVVFRGEAAEFEQVDGYGRVTLRVRWTDAPRPLDASHRGAMAAFMRRNAPPQASAEVLDPMIARLEEMMPLPDVLPHLGDLRLGDDGAIWLGWPERSGLELPTAPELVREWRVVVPGEGERKPRVFKVVLPEGMTLLGPAASTPTDVASDATVETNGVREGAFHVLLRDETGRQGIGTLRHRAGTP